jgi:hypothetical protein
MNSRQWRWLTAILGLVMIAVGWGDYRDGLVIGGSILIAAVVIGIALPSQKSQD